MYKKHNDINHNNRNNVLVCYVYSNSHNDINHNNRNTAIMILQGYD